MLGSPVGSNYHRRYYHRNQKAKQWKLNQWASVRYPVDISSLNWTSTTALPNPLGIFPWVDSYFLMEKGLWSVAPLCHQAFLDKLKARSYSALLYLETALWNNPRTLREKCCILEWQDRNIGLGDDELKQRCSGLLKDIGIFVFIVSVCIWPFPSIFFRVPG